MGLRWLAGDWSGSRVKVLAEIGADLVGHRFGDGLDTVVWAPRGVEAAIAAAAGGLAATLAGRFTTQIGLPQGMATVPTGTDDRVFHDQASCSGGWSETYVAEA